MEILVWPATALIFGIIALLLFRAPIAALIARTKKVGKDGLEAYESLPAPPSEDKKGVEEFFKTFDSALLLEAEQIIHRDLKDRKIEAPADREKALVRALASANLLQHFERVYGNIWLSHLTCLRFLNPRDSGAALDELRPAYEAAKQAFPNFYTDYPFERWLGFLVHMNLVRAQDVRVHITVAGREFLKYLIATAKPDPHYG